MSPQITYWTDELIDRQRQELLAQAGLSFEDLRERAASYQLDDEQDVIYRELQDLDYLQAKSA